MARSKKVNFVLIPEVSEDGERRRADEYVLLDRIAADWHPHLADALILLAWRVGWSEDKDGKLILGQCKKASDLGKELREHDFVILLNKEAWETLSDSQREALLDHELSHCAVSLDDKGKPRKDDRGRTVYRLRKHDIEDFTAVIRRHGCYKRDLEDFVHAALEAKSTPLFQDDQQQPYGVVG